jgi:hypothetical protein
MLVMRFGRLAVAVILMALPGALSAQVVRINGTVVNERLEPIRGATLRLTGADSSLVTGPDGAFEFRGIFPNGMILTVSAPGYEFRSIPLSPGNTTLTITMKSGITTLEKMVVRPKGVRVKGQVADEKTGDALLFARVTLYPDGRAVDASNVGNFRFDSIQGPVTLVIEAMEHLPVQVVLNPSRDTTIKIRMPIDSVAIRMIAQQVVRLTKRSQAVPHTLKSADRRTIQIEARMSISEMVDKMLVRSVNTGRWMRDQSADDGCVFFDDKKIAPAQLVGIIPEIVERVEVYARGAMIRVYSKRYVMSLMGQDQLRKVIYLPIGMRPVCE